MIANLPKSPVVTLGLFAAISAGLVTAVYLLTQVPIKSAEARWFQLRLAAVLLPDAADDNSLLTDRIRQLPAPADCERCWHDGQLLEQDGMIFTAGSPPIFAIPTASRRGYNGRIDVITGVGLAGEQQTPTIVAVEISRHRETPGIGDRIEADRTPWLTQFRNRTSTAGIDALSGATISALAVADAVDKALEFARANRDQLTAQAEP